MTDHKFKVGDIVRRKVSEPMKITGLTIDGRIAGCYSLDGEFIDDFYVKELERIPATDADVVERVTSDMHEIVRKFDDNPIWEGDEFSADEIYRRHAYEIAQAAITALTSSGYTRSPKLDVNQMMLEAIEYTMANLKQIREKLKPSSLDFHGKNNCITFTQQLTEECIANLMEAAIASGSEG